MIPRTILVATNNQNKLAEIVAILSVPGLTFRSLAEFESVPEVAETGRTFRANATAARPGYIMSRPH